MRCGGAFAFLMLAGLPLAAQSAAPPSVTRPWTQPKTAWGDPDLQGVWPGTDMVGTPLERPRNFGTRNVLNDEEFAQRQARAKTQSEIDEQATVNDVTRCDPNRGGLGNTPTTCKDGVSTVSYTHLTLPTSDLV